MKTTKVIKKGVATAMDGSTLWINTTTDEKLPLILKMIISVGIFIVKH